MSLAFNAIIILIAAGPVLAFSGGTNAALCQMLIVALALASVTAKARNLDINQFGRASSGILVMAAIVPAWIALQLLPLPLALSHSIWASANEALQTGSFGHITVDLGATLGSLFSALSALALVAVTVIVARDRRRAELFLLAAAAATSFVALTVLIQSIGPLQTAFAARVPSDVAVNLGCCGIVINLAAILLAYERRETRHQAAAPFIPIGIGAVAGVLLNVAALAAIGTVPNLVAAAFGVALFGLIFMIRRLDLSAWPIAALCIAAVVAAALIVAWLGDKNPNAPALLRFLPNLPSASAIERILAEARWLGSGAGTFPQIARIYQAGDDTMALVAPTTAAAVSIELGRIGLLGAVAATLALLIKLCRGALKRGRDSFFPAAAAGCVAATSFEAFVGSGLLQSSVATLLAIIVGLGLSQGFSQTAR